MFRKIKLFFTLGLILLVLVFLIIPQTTHAGALTALSDTMSRLADSTPSAVYSDHTIRYTTPSGVAAGQTMQITMPTGFTIGTVDYTDIDVSWGATTGYENELTLAATCLTTTWGAVFAGQVLTITSCTGTITSTNKVVVEIGNNASGGNAQIQNHATAATYTISIAGSFTDTGKIAIVILTNDQFTVTGTVDPTITFSLSANATDFGVISTSSPTTSTPNITLTISTNAGSGYTITVQDEGSGSNPGIYNSIALAIIGSADNSYNNNADLSAVAGYGIQCSSASATCAAPYNVGTTNVGGYERTAQNLATFGGTADGHTVVITSKAKAAGTTPAGTYNDTVTVIATGNF
ncbi:MAG: Uncharacterized protein CEN92_271 [Candidatus Berkelbacteria bacterium Licking1014_96]|uniref:Uncharacterized protein n=1 Tax=Candidatus Berkelbacteria bacterium Licking1014_96 TaxID=2017149 RepID=A0A554LFN6_9BACT|nr:MAG: Uncharacterized protein CEN92_271 [Candidatus Berkelbacteria bacterium Licking1014_96]